jgi:hypothetical protein
VRRLEAGCQIDVLDRGRAGQLERARGVDALEDEERREGDDEARQFRGDDREAVDQPHHEPEQKHEPHRRPDVDVLMGGQVGEQQARAPDHYAGREIELPADHQQRHRHGDDPVLRRLIGPAGRDRGIADPVHGPSEIGECEEHRHRTQKRADVRARQHPAKEPSPDDTLVHPDVLGCGLGHSFLLQAVGGRAAAHPYRF